MKKEYDIIVVGAGHAGCEAARAAALLGSQVLLITMDMERIAQMSCNPAIGGIAKGQIVREIDALGGFMGIATDESTIQFRMLNMSKGAAMWSPRAQTDRKLFSRLWRNELEQTPNLLIWQDSVVQLILDEDGKSVRGVYTHLGVEFIAPKVVLANGTFLNGLMHFGKVQIEGGRIAEPAAHGLTEQLRELGFHTDRMKTGTPMRLDASTIDYSLCQEQAGDDTWYHFSYLPRVTNKALPQRSCYITYTNAEVHKVLNDHLDEAPLYNGQIVSIGPRYCPSIETKIKTFAERNQHQLFIEPEGVETTEVYLNGFSSSMPYEVQLEAIKHIPALANAHVLRPGYAIEYDFFDPTQLYHTMETKLISGLYFAGQINGTTGYEEAGGQGLVAGINAHLSLHVKQPFVLSRDEAYIGVMIDDLVTKGVDEPYRMFTSRAEYRILLRQDNADERLTERGYDLGLVDQGRMEVLRNKLVLKKELLELTATTSIAPSEELNAFLVACNSNPLSGSVKLRDLILRPGVSYNSLKSFSEKLSQFYTKYGAVQEVVESAEITIKYAGYIERERQLAEKAKRLEDIEIGGRFKYEDLHSLSIEARQKLEKINPQTIGQASRIPGISPADINILLVLLGR
ncbi:tRNA uridine-5-carboxymethylaminomethyl(34) synthesis enzyme MnmG [Porphyromonas levii]|uniref:tRNA uridine 5-carboxymethylaminomethyl modification enzyme MnmG n=1 Tax=Porphyromonas levii TaxID=28114 RepID=A0A4Y8WQX2_9PORP|nr:tRNA uridine-5-carboxymethylaminomethyl(34) synthesis enzyme MnmG [Porphyromonas levii]MBR8759123.1 tRNA uridine 5-carboxymethylaminomethyl modification enzyme MnmG [Porphyromonas levii]TFH96666.1 tRNA uridine-5-carboxymethylaminomethyl(34) synthesis enzyme MnmG [Porphyromonas levii]TFH96995.1 tRNA uridine-5-carboxymethylaminomethyl(34) synthesis enzyme MnmG [Porphyromonas levii]